MNEHADDHLPIDQEVEGELLCVRDALLSWMGSHEYGGVRRAVSSAYYAVFHTAKALLASRGIFAKTHSGVKSRFAHDFLRDGDIKKEVSQIISRLESERLSSDYNPWIPVEDDDSLLAGYYAAIFIRQSLLVLPKAMDHLPSVSSLIGTLDQVDNFIQEKKQLLAPSPFF